jgi:hypothetical protein
MRKWINQLSTQGGIEIEELPWSVADYMQAIEDAEAEITPRRIRESVLNESGRLWLQTKEAEIQILRDEMIKI